MALNFPSNPTVNQLYTPAGAAQSYTWNGTVWKGVGINLNFVSRGGDTLTGSLYLPNGSEASPSLSVTGQQNCGIFFKTSTVAVSTLGTETFTIAGSGVYGRVGINNPTPNYELDIKPGIGNASSVRLNAPNGTTLTLSSNNTANDIYSYDSSGTGAGVFRVFSGPNVAINVDTSNRVGIGATPGAKLDVQSATGNVVRSFSTSGSDARFVAKTSTNETIFGSDSTGSYILQAAALPMRFSVSNTEVIRILSDVSVGIGQDTTDSFVNITGTKSSNILHIRSSVGSNYNGIIFRSETLGGQNGGVRIIPNTTPGGGSAEFTTRFSSNTSGGTVNHNVVVDGNLKASGRIDFSTSTSGTTISSGTSAQRPNTPIVGEERYNTTIRHKEIFVEQFGWTPIVRQSNYNEILNGDFSVWQRGETFNNAVNGQYLADRWCCLYSGTGLTRDITKGDSTGWNGTTGAFGASYDIPYNPPVPSIYLRWNQSGTASGVTYNLLRHTSVGASYFSNHNYVTLSFSARSSTSSQIGNIYGVQKFGIGGSSDVVFGISGGVVNLTPSWQQYTFTFAVPPVSGKIFGLHNQFVIDFNLPLTSGSAIVDIGLVKLEGGAAATAGWAWRENSYITVLRECQKNFFKDFRTTYIEGYMSGVNANLLVYRDFPVPLYTNPNISNAVITSANMTTPSIDFADNYQYRIRGYATAVGGAYINLDWGTEFNSELPVL